MTESKKNQLAVVHKNLDKLISDKLEAMPKAFNKTRFLQNCMSVLQDVKDIDKMEPLSIARTMLKGAFLGLDFFNKECHPVPYTNKDTGVKELNFQTDYKGEVKLCRLYSTKPLKNIYAKVVRQGDEFLETIEDGNQCITFNPQAFNDGEIVGAFAVAEFTDGSVLHETMSRAQIEKVRKDYSKCPSSPAWQKSFGEMCRKTVLRRLCKNIDLSFDRAEQDKAFDEGGDLDKSKIVEGDVVVCEDAFDKSNKFKEGRQDGEVKVEAIESSSEERGDPSELTEEEKKQYRVE